MKFYIFIYNSSIFCFFRLFIILLLASATFVNSSSGFIELKDQYATCQELKKNHIVEINEVDQELLLTQAELNCFIQLQLPTNSKYYHYYYYYYYF